MSHNTKGARLERELVSELDQRGYAVMRAPSSGAATERDLPDVLASNGETIVAVEAKSSSGKPIYVGKDEIQALTRFSQRFQATPLVGVRFNREPWYFHDPDELHDSGKNLRVKKEYAKQHGQTIDEL